MCGGGTTTTVASHSQAGAGQRSSCQAEEECGCDACVRLRIVKFLPWLTAPDIAVGAHVPGGAMVIPELPEREPDMTPPWMWVWWEDGGGTSFVAPESREATGASSQKVQDKDTGVISGPTGSANDGDDEETDAGPKPGEALEYWEDKKHHMDDQFATPKGNVSGSTGSGGAAPAPCWPLPVTVNMWLLPVLAAVCELNLGPSRAYPSWTNGMYYLLPSDYVPTRSKKDMREYCIPEWENARTVSWSTLAERISVGTIERAPGLFWSDGPGFYHGAIKYALATMHTFADCIEAPTVFSTPCKLTADEVRSDIESTYPYMFTVVAKVAEVVSMFPMGDPPTGIITVQAGSGSTPAGTVSVSLSSSSPIAFAFETVIRLNHHKAANAALADYYFWWAWRLYSYGMDSGSENALTMAKLAAKAALSEINEIAGLLVHEYSHLKGGSWEDKEPFGGPCVNCCHYLSHWTFLSQVLAETATPFPMVWRGDVTGATEVSFRSGTLAPAGRFDFSTSDGWAIQKLRNTTDDGCSNQTLDVSFCSFWDAGEPVAAKWNIGPNQPLDESTGKPFVTCWEEIDGHGSDGGQTFPARKGCNR